MTEEQEPRISDQSLNRIKSILNCSDDEWGELRSKFDLAGVVSIFQKTMSEAVRDYPDFVEAANGLRLFLDTIGRHPMIRRQIGFNAIQGNEQSHTVLAKNAWDELMVESLKFRNIEVRKSGVQETLELMGVLLELFEETIDMFSTASANLSKKRGRPRNMSAMLAASQVFSTLNSAGYSCTTNVNSQYFQILEIVFADLFPTEKGESYRRYGAEVISQHKKKEIDD